MTGGKKLPPRRAPDGVEEAAPVEVEAEQGRPAGAQAGVGPRDALRQEIARRQLVGVTVAVVADAEVGRRGELRPVGCRVCLCVWGVWGWLGGCGGTERASERATGWPMI